VSRFEFLAVLLVGCVLAAAVTLGALRGDASVHPDDPRQLSDPHGLGLEAGRAARAGIDPLRPPGLPEGVTIDPATGFLTGLGLQLEEDEQRLPWAELTSLNDVTRMADLPPEIARLDGRRVVMAGFLMPLYKLRDIREFAFVGSHYTCCFQRRPGLGDQIVVQLAPNEPALQLSIKPLSVRGVLRLKPRHWYESGAGPLLSVLEIEDARATPLE
jgi:hypothetical protein